MKECLSFLGFFILLVSGCREQEISPADHAYDSLNNALTQVLLEAADSAGLDYFTLPESDAYDQIPQDPRNPLSPEKVELGKLLFHETALAVNPKRQKGLMKTSCATCHHVDAGFQANRRQGLGEGGIGFGNKGEARIVDTSYILEDMDLQPLRTPSVLNVAYQENMLWNGQFGVYGDNEGTQEVWEVDSLLDVNFMGYSGVETQALSAIDVHRMEIENTVADSLGTYIDLFKKSFPGEPIDKERAALALAAYQRVLLPNQAPFQRWLKGEKQAMTAIQKQGAILFFGKANCVACHTGPALSENEFHALGMNDLVGEDVMGGLNNAGRYGRGAFTQKAEDFYTFKVPQLYNLKDSPFYGHGGSFSSIRKVIEYKNEAEKENRAVPDFLLADEFVPLELSEEEVDQITAFVRNALHDSNLSRYVPPSLPSGLCFPNNDQQSKKDLDCQ